MRTRARYLRNRVTCFMAPRHVVIHHTCVLRERDLGLRKRDLSFCTRATYLCAVAPLHVTINTLASRHHQHTRALYATQWRHRISVDQCRWPPMDQIRGFFAERYVSFCGELGLFFGAQSVSMTLCGPYWCKLETESLVRNLGVAYRNGTCVCKTMA